MKENKREKKRKEKEFQKNLEKYKSSKYVKVNDDWYPNFDKNKVRVRIGINWYGYKGKAYITVWGADDTGVELIHSSENFDLLVKTWEKYQEIYDNIPQTTNRKWYLDRKFKCA